MIEQRLREEARRLGILLSDRQANSLVLYMRALIEKNRSINLTAITGEEDFFNRHLLDSLTAASLPALCGKVLDLGTGGGFPGVVIAVARPDTRVTLLDATAKKIRAVEELAKRAEITVSLLTGRAEELGRKKEHRARYDTVVARAVADLAVLVEYAFPLLAVGGHLIAMKGAHVEAEAELRDAAGIMGVLFGRVSDLSSFELPGGLPRTLIVLQKTKETPPRYPRTEKQIRTRKPGASTARIKRQDASGQ